MSSPQPAAILWFSPPPLSSLATLSYDQPHQLFPRPCPFRQPPSMVTPSATLVIPSATSVIPSATSVIPSATASGLERHTSLVALLSAILLFAYVFYEDQKRQRHQCLLPIQAGGPAQPGGAPGPGQPGGALGVGQQGAPGVGPVNIPPLPPVVQGCRAGIRTLWGLLLT